MSLWQTPTWQHMLQKSGQAEQFFEVEIQKDGFSGQAQEGQIQKVYVEKRQVSLGELGLFVVGISLDELRQAQGTSEGQKKGEFFSRLQELCKKEKCLFVQVETLDYDSPPAPLQERGPHGVSSLSSQGRGREEFLIENDKLIFSAGYYKKFIPPYTAVIDLTKSEEEILAAMKPKGRYNIRLAEKKGVIVEQVEKNPYNADIFFKLISQTTDRNKFSGNTAQYYEVFLKSLKDSQLFFAYFQEQVIAAGIFVPSGDTMIYYYGASASEHRNLMTPYLLQWTALCHAKKRGLKLYDFLGVAGPDEIDSPLGGVTDFKLKLTPDVRHVSKSYIYVNKKWKYRVIQLLKRRKK